MFLANQIMKRPNTVHNYLLINDDEKKKTSGHQSMSPSFMSFAAGMVCVLVIGLPLFLVGVKQLTEECLNRHEAHECNNYDVKAKQYLYIRDCTLDYANVSETVMQDKMKNKKMTGESGRWLLARRQTDECFNKKIKYSSKWTSSKKHKKRKIKTYTWQTINETYYDPCINGDAFYGDKDACWRPGGWDLRGGLEDWLDVSKYGVHIDDDKWGDTCTKSRKNTNRWQEMGIEAPFQYSALVHVESTGMPVGVQRSGEVSDETVRKGSVSKEDLCEHWEPANETHSGEVMKTAAYVFFGIGALLIAVSVYIFFTS